MSLLFVTRTHAGDRKCLFCHFYDNTSCFKIADGVTRTIFVATVSSHDWQSYFNLRPLLKTRPSVTNSLTFVRQNGIVHLLLIDAKILKFLCFNCRYFWWRLFWNLSQARECIPGFSSKKVKFVFPTPHDFRKYRFMNVVGVHHDP